MLGNLTGLHLLIILGIVLLLFGATKLPALAKGLGQSINVFKKEMDTKDDKDGTVSTTAAPQSSTAPVVNPAPSVQPNSSTQTPTDPRI